jgi:hypothetical protein
MAKDLAVRDAASFKASIAAGPGAAAGREAGGLSPNPSSRDATQFADCLPTERVRALLHIGDRALNDYDRRGWLHPIRVGRRKLYTATEVLDLMMNGTPKNPSRSRK